VKVSEIRTAVIYCDGGCRNNGSEGAKAYGSFAVVVNGEVQRVERMDFPVHTNNQAEYLALQSAINYIIADDRRLRLAWKIRTDSQLVVNQLAGRARVKAAGLKDLHHDVVMALSCYDITVEWTPREEVASILGH